MDCVAKRKYSDCKVARSMESDDFGSCDNLWDDDEFMSCEEGEEEVFLNILSASKEADFIEQTAGIVEDFEVFDVRKSSNHEKIRICSDPGSVQNTDQSGFVVIGSTDIDKSNTESIATSYTHKDKIRSNYASLTRSGSAFGGIRGFETVKEVGPRLRHMNCEITPLTSVKSSRIAEGLLYKNRGNVDFLASRLEYEKALFRVLDKTAGSFSSGAISSFDEKDEEISEESDDEFHDTRSSLSRVQSLDDDFMNILEDECVNTLEDEECSNILEVQVCTNVLYDEACTNMLEDKEHANILEGEECTKTLECDAFTNTLEDENYTSVLEAADETYDEYEDIEKEPRNKDNVCLFVARNNPGIDSEQSDIKFQFHPHGWISTDSNGQQKDCSLYSILAASESEDRSFQKCDLSSNLEVAMNLNVLDCSGGSQLSIENLSHNQDMKLILKDQDLKCNTPVQPSQQAGHYDLKSALLPSALKSLGDIKSCSLPERAVLRTEVSEVPSSVNVNTEVYEICSSVNTTMCQISETLSAVNETQQQFFEVPPSVSATKQVSQTAPSVSATKQVPQTSVSAAKQVSQTAPSVSATKQVPQTTPSVSAAKQVPQTSVSAAEQVSQTAPSVSATKQVPQTTPSVSAAKQVPQTTPSVSAAEQVSQTAPPVSATKQVSKTTTSVSATKQVPQTTPSVSAAKQVPQTTPSVSAAEQVSQTAPSVSATKQVSQTATSVSATKQVSQTTPSVSATKQVSQTATSVSATKQVSQTTPSVSATKQVSQTATSASATKQVSQTTTSVSATKQVSQTAPPVSATKQVSQTTTSASATKQVSQTTPSVSATEQVSQTAPPVSATKQVSQTTTSASATKQVSQTTPSVSATEQVSQTAPSVSATKQVSQTTQSESATKQVSQTTPSVSATKQVSQTATSASATKQVSQTTTSVSATKQVSQTAPPVSATKQVSQTTTSASATKQVSQTAPSASATKQVSQTAPSVSATKQVSQTAPSVSATKQVSQTAPSVSATKQVSQTTPSVSATKQLSQTAPSVSANEVFQSPQSVSTNKKASVALLSVSATKQFSEVPPSVSAAKQVSEAILKQVSGAPTKQGSKAPPSVSAVKQVSEVPPSVSTTKQVSKVSMNAGNKILEVPPLVSAAKQVIEVPPSVNKQVLHSVSAGKQESETHKPVKSDLVQESETLLSGNVDEQVSEVPLSVSATEDQVSLILPSVNATEEQASEVLSPVNATKQQASAVLSPVNATKQQASAVLSPVNATKQQASAVLSPVNVTRQQAHEVLSPVNVTRQQAHEVLSPVNVTRQQAHEVLSPVNVTKQQISEVLAELSLPQKHCSQNIKELSEISQRKTASPELPLITATRLTDMNPLLNKAKKCTDQTKPSANALNNPSDVTRKSDHFVNPESDLASIKTHLGSNKTEVASSNVDIFPTEHSVIEIEASRNTEYKSTELPSQDVEDVTRDVSQINVKQSVDTSTSLTTNKLVSITDLERDKGKVCPPTTTSTNLQDQLTKDWKQINFNRISSSPSSSNLFHKTLQDIPHSSNKAESIEASWTDRSQITSLEELSSQDIVSQMGNSPFTTLNDPFSSVSGEKAVKYIQDSPSSYIMLPGTLTYEAGITLTPTHETEMIRNSTPSTADQHPLSLETQQPFADKLTVQHPSLEAKLNQLSSSTPEVIPHGLPLEQDPCIISQRAETKRNKDTEQPIINTNYDRNSINISEVSIEIFDKYDKTCNDEERVSDDSLSEGMSNAASLDTCCDEVAGFGSSPDSDLSDSLEEVEHTKVDNHKDVLQRFETEPKQIDRQQAKLRSSLSWLLSKVYGSNIPKELQDPFYETAEGQLVLRPIMVNMMSSSELYCQACSNMFPETHTQWQGHWSIIQVLSRKGIYISEVQESAVTETVLVQTAPFRLKAHLALIDALMKAYIGEVASVEKVVKAVRQITTFPASSELPGTPEEALIFWINKICSVLGTEVGSKRRTEEIVEGISGQKVRVFSKTCPHFEPVQVPLLEDLMRDVGDGCSVAAVIAFYRPHLLNIKGLCLKEGIGIADSLHNLCQIGEFCRNHLPSKNFYLSYEDLLYTHDVMRVNIIAFLADLFFCFENPNSLESEDSGLGSGKCSSEKVEGMVAAGKKSSQNIHPVVQISQATKRSFHRQGFEETASNLGMGRSGGSSPVSHQPLLSKRIAGRHCIPQEEGGTSVTSSVKRRTGRRAVSLFTPQDRDIVHKSVLAWQDDQEILHRSDNTGSSDSGRLLTNVTDDSMLNQNYNANNILSLDLSDLETPFQSDYFDLESVTSGHNRFNSPQQQIDRRGNKTPTSKNPDHRLEPLMPALLRPTKEKETNLSKAEERGDRSPRRKKMTSPTESQLQPVPPVQRSAAQSPQQRRQPHMDTDSHSSEQSDETAVSPLTPDSASVRSQSPFGKPQSRGVRGRVFEAFVVGPDSDTQVAMDVRYKHGSSGSISQDSDRASDIGTTCSYTVKDRPCSAQAARAAGIPVVTDSEDITSITDRSREGSIASSGEYSDHESQKIHQEYKVRESNLTTTLGTKVADTNINNNKSIMLIADHLGNNTSKCGDDDSSICNKLTTTNFAELKRLKDKLGYNLDKVDGNALIYMQSGSHGGPYDKMSGLDFKSMFVIKQDQGQQQIKDDSGKTGSTNQHPETPSTTPIPDNAMLEAKDSSPGSPEMHQLRLKLEQKRKDIERKKHRQEAQQNKMRQQLGQAAFMRVVSKHIDGEAEGEDQVDTTRLEHSPNSSQAQLQARLGHPLQKLPYDGSSRSQLPAHLVSLQNQGGQNSVIPADKSAQRFTDWRAQSQLSQTGSGNISAMSSAAAAESVPKSLDPAQQQYLLMCAGAVGGSDAGPDYSFLSSGNKAFSREGIQQTIDTVRNKWFKNDSDLLSNERGSSKEEDVDGGSFRLHDGDLLAGARARPVQDHSPARSHSQSPLQGASQVIPPHPDASLPVFPRDTASPPQPVSDMEYQEYDSSLDKLNTSLSELQGEIMRLSLQHEQLKAAQSPVSNQANRFGQRNDSLTTTGAQAVGVSSVQSRPLHGIPQKVPFTQGTRQGIPFSSSQQQLLATPSLPHQNDLAVAGDYGVHAPMDSTELGLSNFPSQNKSTSESGSTLNQFNMTSSESDDIMNLSNDGYFVSFGDKATPKRSKPKFTDRTRGTSPAPSAGQATTPPTGTVISDTAGISSVVAANLAGQTIVPTMTPQRNGSNDELSPHIGFIIKEEIAATKDAGEDDMQKKRIKLIEMQRKRREEQERKKSEKEAETAKKQEEKQLKEEELERKKAEEKARRELIFQQYIQKKQEDEESPSKAHSRKRDTSASKQRPKSMFVKSKALTPEPGTLGPDSGSSSQEDLTSRPNMGGRSTPGVMSALRSSFHFRLPQPSKIRKAVSCNTLQGATNGAHGPSTYRRPTSPDLNRMKQQRQRGNNQDSGSESSLNPAAEYAGPKLFVKPSSRSNRHIIVNAISHCCLAGSVNTDMKNKVLEELSKCDANHYLILFRDAGCQYRGLFVFSPETEEAFKLHGVGPKHIINAMCEKFYKYNSGAKSFSEITSTKHLSVSIDAVVLHTAVWKSVKAVIRR